MTYLTQYITEPNWLALGNAVAISLILIVAIIVFTKYIDGKR